MEFSELTSCPFCGSEQFYTRDYVYGSSAYRQRFDGKEACNNETMYDGLNIKEGQKAYCDRCGKYIGNLATDKLGKEAENAIERRETK